MVKGRHDIATDEIHGGGSESVARLPRDPIGPGALRRGGPSGFLGSPGGCVGRGFEGLRLASLRYSPIDSIPCSSVDRVPASTRSIEERAARASGARGMAVFAQDHT